MHDPYELVRQAKIYLNESHDDVDESIRRLREKYPKIPYGVVQNVMYKALRESLMEDMKTPSGLASVLMAINDYNMDVVRKRLKEKGLKEDQIRDAIQVAETEFRQKTANAVAKPKILERQALDTLILSEGLESHARDDLNRSFPYLDNHMVEEAVRSAMARYPKDIAQRMKENPTLLLTTARTRMGICRDMIMEDLKKTFPHISTDELINAVKTIGLELYG